MLKHPLRLALVGLGVVGLLLVVLWAARIPDVLGTASDAVAGPALESYLPPAEPDETQPNEGLGEPIGFGRGTSGGTGGPVRMVEHLEDDGPGSLREAVATPGPAVVRFQPGTAGLLTLDAPILIASDLTIDGRDAQVTIDGHGLHVAGGDNVILAHLRFDFAANWEPYNGNAAILVGGASRNVWITHCTFVGAGPGEYNQGLLLIDRASRITASWNRFVEWDRTIMVGQDAEDPELAADLITLHHNLFVRTYQRNPLVRFGRVHTFNNWLYQFGWPGDGTGMVVDAEGQLFSEADIFEDAFDRYAIKAGDWDSGAPPGYVRHRDSVFLGVSPDLVDELRPGRVFDPADFYPYEPDLPDDDLRRALDERAGSQSGAASAGRRETTP
jgi:pectate lyase